MAMSRPGRKSAASLAIPRAFDDRRVRLPAPTSLTSIEQEIWNDAVNDQPAGSFTAVHSPILEQYCRHSAQAKVIAEAIRSFNQADLNTEEGLVRYKTLLQMQERESRTMTHLAGKLRITRMSVDNTVIARALVNEPSARKPWELSYDA